MNRKNKMKKTSARSAAALLLLLALLLCACEQTPSIGTVSARPTEQTDSTGPKTPDGSQTTEKDPTNASSPEGPTFVQTGEETVPTPVVPTPTPTETQTPLPTVTPGIEEGPFLTEVMPHNNHYPVDGVFTPFIELYNPLDRPIALCDYTLYDGQTFSPLPDTVLDPGAYAAVPAEALDLVLSRQGKTLEVRRVSGGTVCSFSYPALESNTSSCEGGYALPTPGYENSDRGYADYINGRTALRINEVITANSRYLPKDGDTHDVIELYNAGGTPIDLSSFCISDSRKNPGKYRLPEATLEAGGYYLVYCDNDVTAEGYAPFSLSQDGEFILLTGLDGRVFDAFEVPHLPADRSWGRGKGGMRYFETPSLGSANPDGYNGLSGTPGSSLPGGLYRGEQTVTLTGAGRIFYTTDGSRPTVDSALYGGETIRVSKTLTVRALMLEEGKLIGEDVAFDYIVDPFDFSLPVVKLTVVDSDLYGEGGIYTEPYYNDKELEIEGHIAMYIDGKEEFSLNCGVKVHGNYSRRYDKKSLQIKFRSRFGTSKLNYDLFGDGQNEWKGFVLRSGSQERNVAMMRDEFATSLAGEYCPTVLVQKYRPCNVYLNDKYVGVYYIREKIGQDFAARHLGGLSSSATVVATMMYREWGDGGNWEQIRSFYRSHDLSVEENYRYIEERVDLDSIIDYYILLVWADNRDEGNTRICRVASGGKDDKWRFIFYDNDLGFGSYLQDRDPSSAHFILGSYYDGDSRINNALFLKLTENPRFRDRFFIRLSELCRTMFSDAVVNARIDDIASAIAHDLAYDPYIGFSGWQSTRVPELKAYVTGRGAKLIEEFSVLFGLSSAEKARYFE